MYDFANRRGVSSLVRDAIGRFSLALVLDCRSAAMKGEALLLVGELMNNFFEQIFTTWQNM